MGFVRFVGLSRRLGGLRFVVCIWVGFVHSVLWVFVICCGGVVRLVIIAG